MSKPRSRSRRSLIAGVALAIALPACGTSPPSRAAVVGALTDEQVPARYDELAASATQLVTTSAAFCATDRADPGDVLAQVTVVRNHWAALRPFWFGPAMERRSRTIIDYPANTDEVAELAAGEAPVDESALRELVGADQRGLGAIELLVVDSVDDRDCEYLRSSAALVADETAGLASDWESFGPTQSVDDAAANEALGEIVSETLFALPLTGSDNLLASGQLVGTRWAMLGDGADVQGISLLLDDEVLRQLTAEFDALADAPSFDAAMAVEQTIKTNVVGSLGITVKFSDADGDG